MSNVAKQFSRMIDYALERPQSAPSRVLVVSLTKSNIEKILTPARVEIVRTIVKEKPKTVGALVRLLKRPKESVSRDLRILSNYGLLSFVQAGREKTPRVEKDVITMPLTA